MHLSYSSLFLGAVLLTSIASGACIPSSIKSTISGQSPIVADYPNQFSVVPSIDGDNAWEISLTIPDASVCFPNKQANLVLTPSADDVRHAVQAASLPAPNAVHVPLSCSMDQGTNSVQCTAIVDEASHSTLRPISYDCNLYLVFGQDQSSSASSSVHWSLGAVSFEKAEFRINPALNEFRNIPIDQRGNYRFVDAGFLKKTNLPMPSADPSFSLLSVIFAVICVVVPIAVLAKMWQQQNAFALIKRSISQWSFWSWILFAMVISWAVFSVHAFAILSLEEIFKTAMIAMLPTVLAMSLALTKTSHSKTD